MGLERRVAADASDAERGEKEGSSERELLVAVSTRMASKEQEAEKDDIADAQQKVLKSTTSTVGDVVDEGLGEDFEDTPWVPPTVKRAEDNRAQMLYRGGKSSVWDTRLHELEDMGIGVSLYFQFLKFLTGVYFVLMLLGIPSLLFAVTGQGFTEEVNSSNMLALTMVGNVGYSCEEGSNATHFALGCNFTSGDTQTVFGAEYTHLGVSYYITIFEFIGSVFFILAILYWRRRTNIAVKRVDANKATATDYAVYIEGLPKNAERKSIGQFFSDLYQLEAPDWEGRPPYQQAQTVFNAENTGDSWYIGKWVAEVCVAREIGQEVKAYKDKKDTVFKLRKKRAEAKMYYKGNGADPAKFENAVKAADELGAAIAKTTDKIMEMRKNINEKQACVGCFIVFNHPLSLHRCMEDFSSRRMFKKYPKELTFEGTHKLKVTKAPEPDNIIWENLEFPEWKRAFRQNVTGFLSFVLLLISFALVLLVTGIQDAFAKVVPKIEYCQTEVPALYLSSYSRLQGVSDDLMLVRPDPSYRWEKDERCQHALSDEHAVYMVYTIEEGEDSYLNPVMNYTFDFCETGSAICPQMGDKRHCPCATGENFEMCETLECSDPGRDPGGTCGEFAFATVSGCYCYSRLRDKQKESGIISALNQLWALDWDVCGAFITSWILAKVFSLIMSLLTPIINGVLERCLKGLVTWEHNTSDDATATRLMYGVFQTQFVNTGILFLLVYGTAPFGYETPSFIKNIGILAGPYNDFSREWQMVAGTSLLTRYMLAAVGPHFWPLINIFFISKRRILKATKAVQEDVGMFVMQSELNDVFVGPIFNFTTRYSYLLTLLFVTMAFSGGIFAMNGLSFLFFLVTYWVDKMGILKFYRRPPHREDALQRQVREARRISRQRWEILRYVSQMDEEQLSSWPRTISVLALVNNTLPWALLLHLCFTCWFLGTESLKSGVITESLSSRAGHYNEDLTIYEDKYGILATRILRTNVFPLFLLTVGVFVWCVLEFVGKFFPVLAFLGKLLRYVAEAFTRKRKTTDGGDDDGDDAAVTQPGRPNRSRWTSEVAAYTDVYFQYIPKNSDLTTAEKLEGWMISHLADKSTVKKKGWGMDEEAPPAGREDAKFTWEVIRDNSVFTYRIDLVPAYSEIMAALKEEERVYREDLAAESDDTTDDSEEDERDDDGSESDDGEESKTSASAASKKPRKSNALGNTSNPFLDIKAGLDDEETAAVDDYNPFEDFVKGDNGEESKTSASAASKKPRKSNAPENTSNPFLDFEAGSDDEETAAVDDYNPFEDFAKGVDED